MSVRSKQWSAGFKGGGHPALLKERGRPARIKERGRLARIRQWVEQAEVPKRKTLAHHIVRPARRQPPLGSPPSRSVGVLARIRQWVAQAEVPKRKTLAHHIVRPARRQPPLGSPPCQSFANPGGFTDAPELF